MLYLLQYGSKENWGKPLHVSQTEDSLLGGKIPHRQISQTIIIFGKVKPLQKDEVKLPVSFKIQKKKQWHRENYY